MKPTKTCLLASVCFACLAFGIPHGHAQEAAASAPIVATTAPATTPATQTTVVKNADGSTTTTTTTSYYYDYDKNHNGILDSAEFYNYAYTAWDANHDGYLSPDEWKLATVRWYANTPTEYKTYTYWDKNGDGRIDPTEFDTTVSSTNLYTTWATGPNTTIDNNAYAAQSFRIRDLNGDGVISMDEWRASL
jgi:Ca2+-binding EF-hand superfamily protein